MSFTTAMGTRELEFPGPYLKELQDSSGIADDPEAIRRRMKDEGHMLIRGILPRALVLEARRQIAAMLQEVGQLDPSADPMDLLMARDAEAAYSGVSKEFTSAPAFRELVRCPEIIVFMERLLGGPVFKFDYHWLRVTRPGNNTGIHLDIVYMGRGTKNLFTGWIPIGDVPIEQGPLAVLVGSHKLEKLRNTYGEMDVDRDHVEGWFSNDPVDCQEKFGGEWRTTSFKAGDLLVFTPYTLHGSLNNQTQNFRLTSDTRYQLASDPVDERWVGENPIAHYAWQKGPMVSMEEMREKWGV